MFDGFGQEVWGAHVDSYGRLEHARGGRRACPFRFPGQYEDVETGLYYNRFRYYDPEAGTYVSQDPIGLAGGIRLQAYVRDPLLQLDPLGLSCQTTDRRVGPASHLERFSGGGAVLLPKKVYDFIRKEFGALGRADGLYVMRKVDADRLRTTGNNAFIRKALGIPDSDAAWHGPLVQIDIPDPLSRNPRMPTGLEEAANKLFKPGGYTSGGTPEMVIDPVPWHNTSVSDPFGDGS